jgi:hypothetical protein
MSDAGITLAALFVLGMIGTGLALFVKSARERTEVRNPLPNWARPRGLD